MYNSNKNKTYLCDVCGKPTLDYEEIDNNKKCCLTCFYDALEESVKVRSKNEVFIIKENGEVLK